MSNLLQVNRVYPKALSKEGAVPLFVEFPVHADLQPFLVSSTRAVLWVDKAHPGDAPFVRAAVRDIEAPGDFFWEMAEALIARGIRDEWGSVHPFSREGVDAAILHVKSYGLDDLELLVPRIRVAEEEKGKEAYERPDWLTKVDLPQRPCGWLPDDCVLVVPKDRAFVGVMLHITPKRVCAAIHNASRGVGIATGGE